MNSTQTASKYISISEYSDFFDDIQDNIDNVQNLSESEKLERINIICHNLNNPTEIHNYVQNTQNEINELKMTCKRLREEINMSEHDNRHLKYVNNLYASAISIYTKNICQEKKSNNSISFHNAQNDKDIV